MPKRLHFKPHLLKKVMVFLQCCKDHLTDLLLHCWYQHCKTRLLVKHSDYINVLYFMNTMLAYFKQPRQARYSLFLRSTILGIDNFSFL